MMNDSLYAEIKLKNLGGEKLTCPCVYIEFGFGSNMDIWRFMTFKKAGHKGANYIGWQIFFPTQLCAAHPRSQTGP